jgi:hypothetical protein
MALLNNLFGGQSDTVLRNCRQSLQDQEPGHTDFPVGDLSQAIAKSRKTSHFDADAIADFLDITHGKPQAFLAVSLLYDDSNWGTMAYHLDHIFPQASFSPERMVEAGIDPGKQERYANLMNRVGNLELLLAHENEEKTAKPFGQWITTRDLSFRRRHLIPDDDSLLRFENFEAFIEAREALIGQRLRDLFAPAPSLEKM